MDISTLLKQRRKELKLSPEEVAKKLSISRATYYRYEKSTEKLPSSLIEPLANILEIPPAMFLGLNNLNTMLKTTEQSLLKAEEQANIEFQIEQLSQALGYSLIKSYATSKDNKNIPAIVKNNEIYKITQEDYNSIITSLTDFASFKLNSIYQKNKHN